MISIDQNCNPLWDALPKVQALRSRTIAVTHYIEDVDVAFTQVGADVARGGEPGPLLVERERFYRDGQADWGAALFYSHFLGRLPVEIRQWEPLVGQTLKALAGRLGKSVDELYAELSPGDNWQLIGPSYLRDGGHHRVIGDLTVAESADFVRQVFRRARGDCLTCFPDVDSQERLRNWFHHENALVERLLARHAGGKLIEVYRDWMATYVGAECLGLTSSLFSLAAPPAVFEPIEIFLRDYPQAAELYNQAVAETAPYLRPLETDKGELPFFAVFTHAGHMVRSPVSLQNGELLVDGREFPLAGGSAAAGGTGDRGASGDSEPGVLPRRALADAGILAMGGKALVLALQARLAGPLALPYRGSSYMPASHRLASKLRKAGLLKGRLHPIMRVRFRLLDRLAELDTTIQLPAHLARAMDRTMVPARDLAHEHARLAEEARQRLALLRDPAGRRTWQERNLPSLAAELEALDARRRQLARANPKDPELRQIWKQMKPLELDVLRRTVEQIDTDWQAQDLDYWDSRGAVLPWCIGLGGEEFYKSVLERAEIYEEETD